MKKITKVLVLCSSLCFLTGCGETKDSDPNSGEVDPGTNLQKFDKVVFEDLTVEYDGKSHTIAPVGMPADTKVTYLGDNSFKEIGSYEINILLEKDGYEAKKLSAKLIISLPSIKTAKISPDAEITYDGKDHINDIKVQIEDPSLNEEQIKELYKISGPYVKKDGKDVKEVKDVGTYSFHYKVDKEGHKQLHLYSELKIVGQEFSSLTLFLNAENKEVPYDKKDHANDISVINLANPNAKITKTITKEDGSVTSKVIEVGTYTFTFLVSEANYKDKVLITKLTIFDSENIKNEKNKIFTYLAKDDESKDYSIIFKDLHNKGRLTTLDSKDGVPTILLNEEITDYTVTNQFVFYKNLKDEIWSFELNTSVPVIKKFIDQSANLDFIYIQNTQLIYTRHNKETNNTEICRLEKDNSSTVLYASASISGLKASQNRVYFLEGTLNKNIKTFKLLETDKTVTPTLLSTDISFVSSYVIGKDNIYFYTDNLLNRAICSYEIYGTNKSVKKVMDVTGSNFEFIINDNELFYKKKSGLTEEAEGIFKHYLDNKGEDIQLFDTKANNMNINSLTLFEEQLYFSNQSSQDCHLYRIPSFGKSETATLVK